EGQRSAEQMTSEFNWPASRGRPAAKEPHNFLAAYRLQDDKLAWRIGGRAEGETYPFANMHFCGHPLVVDDLLYVIAQRETELQLLAIRADRGELVWKLVLGDTPRPLSSDPARQRIACV